MDTRRCGRIEAVMQMGAEEDFRKLTKNVLRPGNSSMEPYYIFKMRVMYNC
jgi:hypothetical protein